MPPTPWRDPDPWFYLRTHLEGNPEYIDYLHKSLDAHAKQDLDRLVENVCRYFDREKLTNDLFERIDRLVRLECGPETDVYTVHLKTVADVMERAVRDKRQGRPATATSTASGGGQPPTPPPDPTAPPAPASEAPPPAPEANAQAAASAGSQLRDPPADDQPNPSEVDWQGLLLMPPLTAAEIAERLGQPKDLVERTLRYFRTQHDYGFIKDDDAGRTDAKFRYKMPDVLAHLQRWYVKRQRKGQAPRD